MEELKENTENNNISEIQNKNINLDFNTTSHDLRIPSENSLKNKLRRFIKNFNCYSKNCCGNKRKDFMLTPCKHLFHKECLKLWMEKKNGCPVCRHDLPEYKE